MDWDAPAIVLDARPYGEGDAIATVMTAEHGAHRGLARGGAARGRTAIWQPGNLVQVRWVARLAEQLGSFSAELVHPAAALAMDDALALAMLSAACAVAEGALPEREPHPRVFDGLLHLIAHLSQGEAMLTDLVRWETAAARRSRLRARSGAAAPSPARRQASPSSRRRPAAPSPRRAPACGRRVCCACRRSWWAATKPAPADWRDGLRLTGHFLARDAFGHHHRPLPAARQMLYDRVAALAAESEQHDAG